MRILWIPHASWATPQRARDFCFELASRHEVHVTDWIADFQSPRDYLSVRYARNFLYRRSTDGPVTVHGIARISPALYSASLRRLNQALFRFQLKRVIRSAQIDAVVGTYVAPPPDVHRLIFDLFDDNAGLARMSRRSARLADEIAAVERAYVRRADAVVAATSVLADRLRAAGYRGELAHIPNGVDPDRFSLNDGQRLRATLGLQGPVVGLVGNHERWVELERVLDVAQLLADTPATFLIVGRGSMVSRARQVANAKRLSNVRFVGFVPQPQVYAYFAAIDVGLCPYVRDPSADARSPLRLLSHSAAGSAVISTHLEEVKRMSLPNVTLVEETPEAIAAGVREVLRRPRERPPQIAHYDIRLLARKYEDILAGAPETHAVDQKPSDLSRASS